MKRRVCLTLLFGLAATGPLSLVPSPQDEAISLRGRIIGAGMALESAAVRIDIKGQSTEDEMQRLYRHWGLGDFDGFMAAFRDMRRGNLRFIGGGGSNILIHGVKMTITGSGRRIFLVGEYRGSIFAGTRKKSIRTGRFLAIVLDIDAMNQGEGTIHEDAVVDFQRDDIVLVSYASTPKKIINVHSAK